MSTLSINDLRVEVALAEVGQQAGDLDEARGLRAVAVMNLADPGESSADNIEAAAAVADMC